jgi:hypothetical protein
MDNAELNFDALHETQCQIFREHYTVVYHLLLSSESTALHNIGSCKRSQSIGNQYGMDTPEAGL